MTEKTGMEQTAVRDYTRWKPTFGSARMAAIQETGIEFDRFPATCPWPCSSLLEDNSHPGGA